jgi:hypothetical protein
MDARFENMCDVRSPYLGNLHAKVGEYLSSFNCCVLAGCDVLCGGCRVLGGAFVTKSEWGR